MTFIHRAILYVTRKRGKSMLLLLILLVVAALVLSGVAIRDATATAQLNVRQALGGVFTLRQNASDPSKWVSSQVGGYGSTSYYGGAPLTVELADYIQSSVGGIRGYNATYTSYVVPVGPDGEVLDLIKSEDDGSGMNSLLAGYGDFTKTISAYASTNTAYDSFFAGGYLELVSGRHFTADEPNAVLISRELAERNGLQVGDRLTLRMSEFKASMLGYGSASAEVEIVGLFQSTAKSTTSLSNWSMENSIFTTLDVVRAVRPDIGGESYERISFYVDDPGELTGIVEAVKALPNLDPTDFAVSVDASGVDAVTEPLDNMSRLISILIALVLAVGAAILYLVLSSRIRERVHETGVLLSLGLPKRSVVAQYIAEILMIAVVAFALSAFASSLIAQTVAGQLLDYAMADAAPTDAAQPSAAKDGVTFTNSGDYAPQFERSSLTQIDVSIQPAAIAAVYGAGFLIICAAVLIAALPVMRMKPREILSKMS